MFFELHSEHKTAYKKLSAPNLGIAESSHQTHIGLSNKSLTFLPNSKEIDENAICIYEDSFAYVDVIFDRIRRKNGTYGSPKIRMGGRGRISLGTMIRDIAKTYIDNEWFLLWFALKSEKIIFFLLRNSSYDYNYLLSIGLNMNELGDRQIGILESGDAFDLIIQHLESKVGAEASKELEVASQVDNMPSKRFKQYDIVRANLNFEKIGRQGEELVNGFFYTKLKGGEISNYIWYNWESESGLPYDFHVEWTNGNIIYLDVKTTNYNFETEMIFSNQEIKHISETDYGYCVYRVYKRDEQTFSLRICDDCKNISTKINALTNNYKNELLQIQIDLRSVKFAISPAIDDFKFDQEIFLNVI